MIHCAVRWKSDSFATRSTERRHDLHRGRAGADDARRVHRRSDTLWSQRELWNIGAGEGVEAVDVGVARVVQHAGGRDHDVDLVVVAARGLELPAAVRRTRSR